MTTIADRLLRAFWELMIRLRIGTEADVAACACKLLQDGIFQLPWAEATALDEPGRRPPAYVRSSCPVVLVMTTGPVLPQMKEEVACLCSRVNLRHGTQLQTRVLERTAFRSLNHIQRPWAASARHVPARPGRSSHR